MIPGLFTTVKAFKACGSNNGGRVEENARSIESMGALTEGCQRCSSRSVKKRRESVISLSRNCIYTVYWSMESDQDAMEDRAKETRNWGDFVWKRIQ